MTHADNLGRAVRGLDDVDPIVATVEHQVDGIAARLPVYGANWTVRSGWLARRELRRMARGGPLSALFIHTQVPAVLTRRQWRHTPTVVSLDATPLQYDELGVHYGHAPGHPRAEAVKFRANRACFEAARHLVTWSEWAKHGLETGYGIDPDRVTVIAPGVRLPVWARPDIAEAGGPTRILFVGGDLERKGGDLLLDAFATLRSEGRDVEVDVVTKADVREQPGVVVHRNMAPNSESLVRLFHQAHIFCLPTRADCHALVLSEAAASGLPAVTTPIAGLGEVVADGETGHLVPVGDGRALTQALRGLLDDPERRRAMGAAARRRAIERFDADRNARRLVDLLLGVAAGGRG